MWSATIHYLLDIAAKRRNRERERFFALYSDSSPRFPPCAHVMRVESFERRNVSKPDKSKSHCITDWSAWNCKRKMCDTRLYTHSSLGISCKTSAFVWDVSIAWCDGECVPNASALPFAPARIRGALAACSSVVAEPYDIGYWSLLKTYVSKLSCLNERSAWCWRLLGCCLDLQISNFLENRNRYTNVFLANLTIFWRKCICIVFSLIRRPAFGTSQVHRQK